MSNLRNFCLSCELFGGFKVRIDIDQCDNINSIIIRIKNSLKNILIENNLESLQNKLQNINYHIHDFSFVDILMDTDQNKIYYVCSHC